MDLEDGEGWFDFSDGRILFEMVYVVFGGCVSKLFKGCRSDFILYVLYNGVI